MMELVAILLLVVAMTFMLVVLIPAFRKGHRSMGRETARLQSVYAEQEAEMVEALASTGRPNPLPAGPQLVGVVVLGTALVACPYVLVGWAMAGWVGVGVGGLLDLLIGAFAFHELAEHRQGVGRARDALRARSMEDARLKCTDPVSSAEHSSRETK